MQLHYFCREKPRPNTRIVAFYSDGSGANLFKCESDGSFKDAHGESYDYDYFCEAGYLNFAYLPDNFLLFFESVEKYGVAK